MATPSTETNNTTPTLLTSLRYDPRLLSSPQNTNYSPTAAPCPYYLLTLHHQRLLRAAEALGFPRDHYTCIATPQQLLTHLDAAVTTYLAAHPAAPLKLRVTLPPGTNTLSTTITPTPPVPLSALFPAHLPLDTNPAWTVHLDSQPTVPTQYTRNKTTNRLVYDAARERAGIEGWAGSEEVILWNADGEVMEGSFTSVFVWREGRGWVTPRESAGGLPGVVRRWALEAGVCEEGRVEKGEVKRGAVVVLGNGVRGFWGARVGWEGWGNWEV